MNAYFRLISWKECTRFFLYYTILSLFLFGIGKLILKNTFKDGCCSSGYRDSYLIKIADERSLNY
jgi:hypothetical protein